MLTDSSVNRLQPPCDQVNKYNKSKKKSNKKTTTLYHLAKTRKREPKENQDINNENNT